MLDRSWMRRIALAVAAGGVALAAAPLAPDAALAKSGNSNGADNSGGKGGGKDGGKGGGKGGKGGPDTTNLVDPEGDTHGKGHTGTGKGHGKGHGKDAVSGVPSSHELEDGATSNMLGRLNAGHASSNAMANAAPHSAVGLTAQYYDKLADAEAEEDAKVKADLLDEAAGLLADLANKQAVGVEIDAVVEAYNDLLGIDFQNEAVAETEPYSGFTIDQNDNFSETDLIGEVAEEYAERIEDGTFGGGLGPAPAPAP